MRPLPTRIASTAGEPRADPTRTVLVVSELPHPWALLRDRLDPELVHVGWAPPERARATLARHRAGLWAVAGDAARVPAEVFSAVRGRLVFWVWVGPAPVGLPFRPLVRGNWHEVVSELARSLAVRAAGLRLAPGRGVLLPGGACLGRTADLEALLAAHPDGLDGAGRGRGVRRVARLIEQEGLPLRVTGSGGRVYLSVDWPRGWMRSRIAHARR